MPSRPSLLLRSLLLLGVATALFAAPASAQSIHYTVVTDQDTYLEQNNPTTPHGTEQTFLAQRKAGDQFWPLIGFDLSAIPSGALVDSAYLDVYVTREDNTGLPVEVRRVTGAWTESSTWNSAAALVDTTVVWGSFAPVAKNAHYLVDVTGLARAWIEDGVPAEGLALLPTSPDRDSAYQSREFGGTQRHARLELYVSPAVDLAVSKTADLLQPAEGDTVRFTVEISNAGPEDATGVVVSDLLPAGLDYVTHAQTDGSWSKATGDWTIGALAAGKTASLFFVTEVAAGTAGTSLTNTATLTAVDQLDTTAADDTSSVTVDVQDATVNGIDIQVIKTVDRRSAKVGDEVTFSILARNNGTSQAWNISIEDILPAGLTYVSSTSTRGFYDPNSGVWFIFTFTGGDSGRLEITASVDPGTGAQTLVNTASLTSLTGTDLNPDNDADADSVFVLDTDLVLTKTVDLANPEEGQPVRFRIDVENLGPTIAPNVAIADSLPAGLTWLADSTSQGTVSSGTGIWTLGNVDVGETQSLWITASPDPGTAGQTLRNAAGIVASDASDPTPDDDVAEASVVVASADLVAGIAVDDPQPVAGATVTFTLTATNDGPSDATGVIFRTDLPTGLTYLADRPDVGTFDSGTGVWSLGSLLNGDTVALEIDAQVDPGTTGQTILVPVGRSDSSPADPAGGNDQDTVAVYVAGADLAVTKTVSKPEANEGENVIWTVTVANEGLLDATSVAVADTLPAGLSFVSATPSVGAYDELTGIWTVGAVDSGAIHTLAILTQVAPGAVGTTIVNRAEVLSSGVVDPSPANDAAADSVYVPAADLVVGKTVNNPNPVVLSTIQFTVQVTNNGPDDATNVEITDTFPGGLNFVSSSPSQGTYASGTGIWTVGTVPSGGSVSLGLQASVPLAALGQRYVNYADLTAVDQADPATGAESDSAVVQVQGVLPIEQADLTLAKTVNSPTPSEGDTVRWQIVLTNDGPDVATSTEVSDLLPAGVTFAGATASIGSYLPATGRWTIGNLNVAAPETLIVDATVDAGTAGDTITNSASASADQPDPGGASDTAQITVRAADLALAKVVDDPAPSEGGAIAYTIDVWNAGPDSATGVTVVDSLPVGIQYGSSIASQGSYDSGTGVWNVGILAPADTASLAISATIGTGTAGSTIRNVARVGATSEGDPVAANDSAFVDVSVVGADLAIATTVDDANPTELDTIRYTIEATNAGPDSTSGVVIDVAPPAGFLPRGDNASQGTWNGGQDEWTVGALGAGATATLELDLEVPSGSGGGQYWLSAGVQTSALADPDPVNDADSVSVSVVDATGVTVLGSQPTASARPGQTEVVLGTFTLQNTGITGLSLTGATFANTTTGPGTQGQKDAELGTVQIRRDNGNGLYEPSLDLLAGTATVSAGQIVFTGLSVNVPNDGTRIVHVVSNAVPLTARDGDALDLRLDAPASLTFSQGVTTINAWPVDPAGAVTIDGMVAAQIPVTTYASANVERGQTNAGALAFRLPPNGYQSDTLTQARFQNLGTAVAGTDVTAAKLWQDGGDGSFDHGAGDDTLISALTNVGGIWTATGLSVAVPVNGLPAWVSVDVSPTATVGSTIRLAVKGPGPDGLVMTSGNSGPLDTASAASRTLTVTNSVSNVTAWVVDQSNATMIPGAAPRTVFRFEIANESAAAETLSTVRFTNTTVGAVGATQAQLDADWQPLDLLRERLADVGGSGGLPPAGVAGTFSGGLVTFPIDEIIAPGDTAVFVVTSGASVAARDSDRLDLVIASTTDLSFRRAVNVSGSFPLDGAATLRVDGMSSAQFVFGSVDPSILTGVTRALALDVTVPANGYVDDTLLRFDVTNLGNAVAGDDIERVELWSDNGDGLFDPATDSTLGEMLYTGNRWERTGLSLLAPAGVGRRLFVSVDISELATAGRTVRLAVPGPPDFGVGMASDNDGPVDASASSSAQTISTVDRVTVSPLAGSISQVRPGRTNVLLLGFALENHYLTSKTLSGLVVTNRTAGVGSQAELDAEVAQLSIWVDNGDGVFKGAPEDTLRATAFFEDGAAEFTGVNCTIAAGGTRRVFVSADVSLNAAADGDSLATWIDGPAEMTFLLPTALAASFPIDTGAKAIVDGMVAGQVSRFPAPAATLGAGEGPSLVLDVRVPSNGYRSDVLNGLELVNLGNATTADLADVRLWRDGGDGAFDAGGVDDIDLGGLALFGGRWVHPSLTESLPWPGARMFVSVTSSATPTDSATVRFAIPVNGIEVASGNDGPLDAQVANNETTLLSTAVLLSELEITPSATTVDSLVTVTMNVRNLHATATMDSVAPSALTSLPAAGLQYESGPSPALASIAPGGDATFTWTYRASFIGESRLRGLASGVEAGSGIPHQSLTVTSNAVQVYVSSQSLDLYAVSSMPFSINRGQQGVVPLTLTFENPAGPNGTDVELGALRIRLEDDQGNGVVPSDLLSRVVVSEGGSTYLDKTAIEMSGSEVDLTLATPITIQSAGAGSQATVGLALDISDSTAVPFFVVKILDASWFTANDATTGAPVNVNLQDPPVYPVSSGLARVVAEATRLDVTGVTAPDFPAGRGQSAVTVLDVTLNNPDPAGLAADVRVPSFAIALRDSAGLPIPDPQSRIDRIRVRTPNQVHLDRSVTGSDGTTLALSLTTLISVPVNTNLPMSVEFDLADDATLGAFRVELADTSSFEARDANTGAPLPVTYTPDPLAGPLVSVQAAADSMRASGVALMPATIPVGTPNVTAMRIAVEHPGGGEVGPIVIDQLTLGCRDDANQPVIPALYLDRVAVRRGGAEVGVVTAPPIAGGEVVVPLTGVSLAPGERDTLEVRFDAEVTAPATLFALTVSATGIGAMDGNLMLPVTVAPEAGSEFPLSSGFAQLSTPARTLVASFAQSMPAALAADGGDVDAATLTLRNPADPSSGSISIDHLNLRARDRDGNLLAIGSVVERVVSLVDGVLCADSGTLLETDEQATMPCGAPILLDPQDARDVVMRLTLRAGAFADGLRVGLLADDVGVVQPGNPLLSVAVVAEDGQSFPFWTLAGNFGGTNLADSYSNFPNPFAAGRQNTTLAFYLQEPATVTLTLYTLRGQTVRTILAGVPLGAGLHQDATWDGRNGRGDTVANGTYLARIQVSYESGGSDEIVRKVAVVR